MCSRCFSEGAITPILEGEKENVLCCSDDFGDGLESIEEASPELKRGVIHELVPQILDYQMEIPSRYTLSFNEGIAELTPRVLISLQANLYESTQYLLSLTEEDIVTLREIDENKPSYYSSEPISRNRAYASALLGIMWITKNLSQRRFGKPDHLEGTKALIQLMCSYDNSGDIYKAVATELGIGQNEFYDSKQPMLESIEDIRKMYG